MEKVRKNKKYIDIVTTSHQLFWKHGLRKVTVEEICREANVSKMTFYKFFDNKDTLAIEVLRKFFKKGIKDYRAIMEQDIPFIEKIKLQVAKKFEGTNEISTEFISDFLGDHDSVVFKFWNKRKDEMFEMVLADYAEAQQKGQMRKDIKPSFILYFYSKMIEMAEDPQLQAMYGSMQELIMEITNMYFYGILPPCDHE